MSGSQRNWFMDEDTSAWSLLGRSVSGVQLMDQKIADIHATYELLFIEMNRKIAELENRITELEDAPTTRTEQALGESVLNYLSVEELNEITGAKIGKWEEKVESEDDNIRVIEEGFTYEVEGDEISEDSAIDEVAQKIDLHVSENYGIRNVDWKRLGFISQDADKDYRKELHELLIENYDIDVWKMSAGMWFYYRKGRDGKTEYERANATS